MMTSEAKPLVSTSRKVDIYFRKSGRIDITTRVVRALSIKDGDTINILQADGEYYLYVERRASDMKCKMASYRNAVHHTRRNDNMLRCQSIELVKAVNAITEAEESWLFVGNVKSLQPFGINDNGLPLIIHNNQYNK